MGPGVKITSFATVITAEGNSADEEHHPLKRRPGGKGELGLH